MNYDCPHNDKGAGICCECREIIDPVVELLHKEIINLRAQLSTAHINNANIAALREDLAKKDAIIEYLEGREQQYDR